MGVMVPVVAPQPWMHPFDTFISKIIIFYAYTIYVQFKFLKEPNMKYDFF
jgi:hypothetical protein